VASCPPDLLVTPAQLSRYNVPSQFLAQFALKSFVLTITVGGDLGVMEFTWLAVGDTGESASVGTAAGATWMKTIDDVFADLTFASGTYVVDSTYTIDENGIVTPSAGGLPTVTCARFDLRQSACSAATTEAMYLMRDAIRPPLTAWGDDARTHAAALSYAILKRGRGAAPMDAAVGDEHVFRAEDVARKFFEGIGKNGRPDNMTDTSPSHDGPMFAAYPSSDTRRGW